MAEDNQDRIETLQDRVEELETTVSKMLPSRRDALKIGAAGAVGAIGMAGSASAQSSGQVGTIGSDSDRVDLNAQDIDTFSLNSADIANASSDDVPVSQGDGTLTMQKVGSPNFQHVETLTGSDNLPVSESFSSPVNLVRMYHHADEGGVDMQINNVTGSSYEHHEVVGNTTVNNADSVPVIGSGTSSRAHNSQTEIVSWDDNKTKATYESRTAEGVLDMQFFIGAMDVGTPINSLQFSSSDGSNQLYQYTIIGYFVSGGGK
jgi:hypothetical protein